MRKGTRKIALSLLIVMFAATMFAGALTAVAGQPYSFSLLSTGNTDGINEQQVTETDGVFTIAGNLQNDRGVAVLDKGTKLGDKIKFDLQLDWDRAGTDNTGAHINTVYFAIHYIQLDKGDGFDIADVDRGNSNANGVNFKAYYGHYHTWQRQRATVTYKTYSGSDIIHGDTRSTPALSAQPAYVNLGWAIADDKPMSVELGVRKIQGTSYVYMDITTDRDGTIETISNMIAPLSAVVANAEGQGDYYLALEFSNQIETAKNTVINVSNISVESASIVLTPSDPFIKLGGTQQLVAKDLDGQLVTAEFSSSDTSIATVDESGKVTAVAVGSTIITATSNGSWGETFVTVYEGAEGYSFELLDTNTPGSLNSQQVTEEGGVFTISGELEYDRGVALLNVGTKLGDRIKFNLQLDWDTTGTVNVDHYAQVGFGMHYVQLQRKEGGVFDIADIEAANAGINGVRLNAYYGAYTWVPARATINYKTYGGANIIHGDTHVTFSTANGYPQYESDAYMDLGWAIANNVPISVEIGVRDIYGVPYVYMFTTVDRGTRVTTVETLLAPVSEVAKNVDNSGDYYLALEFKNNMTPAKNTVIKVSDINVDSPALQLTPNEVFLKPEKTADLQAKGIDGSAVVGVTYISSKPSVATVDASGKVTAVAPGKTIITATLEDGSWGQATVTVADKITLTPTERVIKLSETMTISAVTSPLKLPVVWHSSDTDVAVVDANGNVTGMSGGTVTITASIKNFETGENQVSAISTIIVDDYEQPANIYEDNYSMLYTERVLGESSVQQLDNGYKLTGSVQSGGSLMVLNRPYSFDKPFSFDVQVNFDVSQTGENTWFRYFGIYVNQTAEGTDNFTADAFKSFVGSETYAYGAQLEFSTNSSWYSQGLKQLLAVRASAKNAQTYHSGMFTTPNDGELNTLPDNDRYASAFARSFNGGTRIRVSLTVEGDEFIITLTPMLVDGQIPVPGQDRHPEGGEREYIGPVSFKFPLADVQGEGDAPHYVAIGFMNNAPATYSAIDITASNINYGELDNLTLNRTSHMMKPDTNYTLRATLIPSSYQPESAEWTTDNAEVATVNAEGVVTAHKPGRATIKYTVDGKDIQCEIIVAGGISVAVKEVTLKVGETYQIEATGDPQDLVLTYYSRKPAMASVSETGLVTALDLDDSVIIEIRQGELYTETVRIIIVSDQQPATDPGCSCSGSFGTGHIIVLSAIVACMGVIVFLRRRNAGK